MKKQLQLIILFTSFILGNSTQNASGQVPQLVKDINSGSGNSNPQSLTNVNGILFFRKEVNQWGSRDKLYKAVKRERSVL